ncbi:subclass B1 metallo-beta-lactamase [Chryseobacterium potabilaquae]|uniref:beta-lactamase n=1 Tax=Chryseobacterium potabilaquae TaxID=2675057 RepID=A0A6N4WZK0_9FLAO|nr:subclass B1 metallo-beta-lactamase [Chryseobacterium potabilaquae]CAA7193912.1 Metallo-beta-lactamase type 2 [Chryseobacterium potabilaquae]
MKPIHFILCLGLLLNLNCSSHESKPDKEPKVLFKSDDLIIRQLSDHVYQHISYYRSETYGTVTCNGMIVEENGNVVIFDTPVDDKSSGELIYWIKNSLHSKINAVIPTHFHEDCLGGLKEFNKNNIPSYANAKTIEFAKKRGFNVPNHSFNNELVLNIGNQKVYAKFYGEGHTRDNVIGYYPKEDIMFGGCLIKEVDALKGNLEDANVKAWPETIRKLKSQYPDVKIVIPGHGKIGGKELLDYTITLFTE